MPSLFRGRSGAVLEADSETASEAAITMFVQNSTPSASVIAPIRKSGKTASDSSASVAPMMKRGFAERCVSCFWKTLETGLAIIRDEQSRQHERIWGRIVELTTPNVVDEPRTRTPSARKNVRPVGSIRFVCRQTGGAKPRFDPAEPSRATAIC